MNDLLSPEQTVEKLFLTGRIDSITCREIEALFRNAIMGGKRLIVADMTAVSYVSSAGLRVFLSVQKELKKAGGEVCFLGCPSTVHSIFEISGFTKIFRFLSTGDDIARFLRSPGGDAEIREVPFDHAVLRVLSRTASAGSLTLIGSEEKLPSASYGEGDVVSVRAADMRFAGGFAALGHSFEDYKGYFGETIVLDGNIFVYPALRRSAVDFIVHTEGEMDTVYHFLHGFSFTGDFAHIVSFEPAGDNRFTLDTLVESAHTVSSSPVIGITAIFESKGLFGMRLKKIPLEEIRGPGEGDIFSGKSFSEWVDYSIEPEDIYNLVVIAGISARQRDRVTGDADRAIPREGRAHVHAVVFDKKPFNRMPDNFPNELRRIVTGMEPQRVVHLMGRSNIGPGLMGIVEIGG
jgi:anti-anti-sigma factor